MRRSESEGRSSALPSGGGRRLMKRSGSAMFYSSGRSELIHTPLSCGNLPTPAVTFMLHAPLSPRNPQQKIIKRVIGLEGDFIRTLGYKNRFVRVPDGHFWIEGDHHGHSLDSNSFGPVSVGLLHGRASHIIWPPNRWQRIRPSLPPNRGPLHAEEEEG
uniref:mitochondrial inner membrane protease subunit 2-like n=1 Tax=Centroberyx gerrardi TaxID=166262 RepID=UPI003AB0D2F3